MEQRQPVGASSNQVYVNGGGIYPNVSTIARTINLGLGGMQVWGTSSNTTISGKITGPGWFDSHSGNLTITNSTNDYSGGTYVNNWLYVAGSGTLGTGPIFIEPSGKLCTTTNSAVNSSQRVTLSSNVAIFNGRGACNWEAASSNPICGSLEGNGTVFLAPRTLTGKALL